MKGGRGWSVKENAPLVHVVGEREWLEEEDKSQEGHMGPAFEDTDLQGNDLRQSGFLHL